MTSSLSFTLLLIFTLILTAKADSRWVGVNYGQTGNNLPQPAQVVSLLQSMKITRVRLLDANPDVLRAFAYTGISLIINVPNGFIPRMASNSSESRHWFARYVQPFFPRTRIATISVGNEVLTAAPELAEFLLPAMRNLHVALAELGLGNDIHVSTAHSLDILSTAFPPSAGEFQDDVVDTVMKPLLDFLASTNGSFLVNIYPYAVYRSEPTIPLGYALFEEGSLNYREDPANGLRYKNLFDCLVDAVVSAMGALGHDDIPVVVTETGWPSAGDPNEGDANVENAAMYNERVVRHVLSGLQAGTPLRRVGHVEIYLFGLLDENMRSGPVSEQHWGILNANMSPKYNMEFSKSGHGRYGGFRYFALLEFLCIICFCMLLWAL